MEPIKQEIINNIFENGDKLITGPILQTVLIDMIDDVNVKDQEILSKTGSWDDAATQIPNLATKEEVTNLSESIARDLENVDVDLTGYATEQWVQDQGYLKEHQDISNLATKTELNAAETNLQGNITSLSESVARDIANVSVPEGVATEAWVQSQDYASKSYVDNAVSSSSVDLTGYATETWVENQGYLKEHQDISGLATKSELTSVSESIQTDITNLSESVANSAVWKKGEGEDSVVQKLPAISITGVYSTPIATGKGAIATGYSKASGINSHAEGSGATAEGSDSHAEGYGTKASGTCGHAEGQFTIALGRASHAEGDHTSASNDYEHAQGMFNHSSENQIFSVGAGEMTPSFEITRRNAISVLAVNNSGSHTASFFVQNVGGYDGTNPEPGTNDLATVISEVSSVWKKGTKTDSIVQVIADGTNLPIASGPRAIAVGESTNASGWNCHAEGKETKASGFASHAEGYGTKALGSDSHAEGLFTTSSGMYSHAEGQSTSAEGRKSHAEGCDTVASGEGSHAEGYQTSASNDYGHAEGYRTNASGMYSHAEGNYTTASNAYEHAQGIYNHSSTNQIFSVGAGTSDSNRKNVISVLAISDYVAQTVTASFFVQNVGGYDGTNPTPGTNDLATVINGISSSGGVGTSTETWTFTLEDGSTVTKNIVMR